MPQTPPKKVVSSKPVARCFDDENGKEYQAAYFQGYSFGDRLLEGVWFKAELLANGLLEVSTAKDSYSYMQNLNEDKWLAEALKYALRNDIFAASDGGSDEELAFKDPFP